MTSMKFANILLETNPRSVAYPALYCRSDQPVVFDEQLGEWKMFTAGTFDFSTYFNSLSVMKLKGRMMTERMHVLWDLCLMR